MPNGTEGNKLFLEKVTKLGKIFYFFKGVFVNCLVDKRILEIELI